MGNQEHDTEKQKELGKATQIYPLQCSVKFGGVAISLAAGSMNWRSDWKGSHFTIILYYLHYTGNSGYDGGDRQDYGSEHLPHFLLFLFWILL